jgi:hypothetical protein
VKHLSEVLGHVDSLGFDADLRAAFMNWLDQEYYAKFSMKNGKINANLDEFTRAFQSAKIKK